MELHAEDITIAVTVYSRREYVCDAINSALNQTVPVKVMVVEDCGPDPGLREFIMAKFGGRIEYFRNSRNRGLFDNWNACVENCRTPWLSILHDDDLLGPNFVETMLRLTTQAPDRALYFGLTARFGENEKSPSRLPASTRSDWHEIDVIKLADECFLFFPGQLLCVSNVLAVGGFRKNSYFTGDWDMWFRLALRYGSVQSATQVSFYRTHHGIDRGTSLVLRKGWKWALDNVQRKRNLNLLKLEKGVQIPFDRTKLLKSSPMSLPLLFHFARGYSRRILFYNGWLFAHGKPPHWRYALMQCLIRVLGSQVIRVASLSKTKC